MANVADVAPAGIVTVAGTLTALWLLESVIWMPPEGATPSRVSVPVTDVPPGALEELIEKRVSDTAFSVRASSTDEAGALAITMAVVFVATDLVVTANVIEVSPAGTLTLPGTVTEGDLELKVILYPAFGAGPSSVNTPVVEVPPTMLVDERLNAASRGALIVRIPLTFSPDSSAVTVASAVEPIGTVVTGNDAEVAPAETRIEEGPPQFVDVEVKVTLIPPVGAAELILRFPVDVDPP